jgi:diguanylate cyclase (GGDEF)-like protein
MEWLSWIDNRTLILCQAILIAAFSLVMLGLRSIYHGLRGAGATTFGFLAAVPGLLMMLREGPSATEEMAIFGGPCLLISSLLLYRGILKFSQSDEAALASLPDRQEKIDSLGRLQPLLYGAAAVTLAICLACAAGWLPMPWVAASLGAAQTLARGFMAWTLYQGAGRRFHLRIFAFTMALFALPPASYVVWGIAHPLTLDALQHSPMQTPRLLMSLVFFCVQGVLYVLLFVGGVSEKVYEQARRDFLTGALNRRGIEDALSSEVARMRRTGGAFAILLIDIDHFKSINDRQGHAAGDEALRLVSRSICDTVRVYDSVGRYGGDEFLLLLPQALSDDAMLTAQRIRSEIRRRFASAGGPPVTVSIGVTCCVTAEEASEIVNRADRALYDAKRAGRDCERLRLARPGRPDRTHVPLGAHPAALDAVEVVSPESVLP